MLDYEIAQEQAAALGRMGRALEAALAALRACDAAGAPAKTSRAILLQQASEMLWQFIVQREACGLRDARQVMREYDVPVEVQSRMGTFVRKPTKRD